MNAPGSEHLITTEIQLRALIGAPAEIVCTKVAHRLNGLTREYVERSPFMCIATSDPDGNCDLSPRGDPAGFVQIIDEAYPQCSKAILRSHLWDPERFITQGDLPSNAEIMRAINGDLIDPVTYDAERAERYARREGFY